MLFIFSRSATPLISSTWAKCMAISMQSALYSSYNHRLLNLMHLKLPPVEHRTQPMFVPVTRGPAVVGLMPSGAIKRISDFGTYSEDNYVTAEALQEAYKISTDAAVSLGSQQQFMICSTAGPEFVSSRHRTSYAVKTYPLGYFSHVRDEEVRKRFYSPCPLYLSARKLLISSLPCCANW